MSQPLYTHQRHQHQPTNINVAVAAERLSLNDRIAVFISKRVGSMACAYIFAGIGVGSLVGVFTNNALLALICGSLSSYFIQLVLLPIIMVGQNVAGRHNELMAEEAFATTQKAYHDGEQLVAHLSAQDALAQEDHEALVAMQQTMLEQREVLYLLLEHLGIEAKLNTAGSLPIVKVGGHTTHINEDDLRISLARAGIKPELLGALPLDMLLALDRARPHEEARHGEL